MVKWEDAKIHVLSHGLHYGTSVFEGIRYYKTGKNSSVFRLQEHLERLFYSAERLEMVLPYSLKEMKKAVVETCRVNEEREGYIRPIIFYGYGKMGLNPAGMNINVAIAVWPWGAYLSKDKIKVMTSSFMRIHPKSLATDAKISGHYVNSVMSSLEMSRLGFDEALLLDYDKNVAEGPGENIFCIKKGVLYTVKLGNILAGITRNSIIRIAREDMGMEVVEKNLKLKDLYESDEAFFTGTAAEIQPIESIDDKVIGNGDIGKYTKKLQQKFSQVVHGENAKYNKWLTPIF